MVKGKERARKKLELPKLVSALPSEHSTLGNLPDGWLVYVEPNLIRPGGWDSCWFYRSRAAKIGRRSVGNYSLDANFSHKQRPRVRVDLADTDERVIINVNLQEYVARLFWRYPNENRKVVWNNGRAGVKQSQIVVGNVCRNYHCVNPAHFEFRLHGQRPGEEVLDKREVTAEERHRESVRKRELKRAEKAMKLKRLRAKPEEIPAIEREYEDLKAELEEIRRGEKNE